MNVLNRLLLWQKLAILSVGLLTPGLILGYMHVSSERATLAVTQREQVGAQYLQALTDVIGPISRHRGQSGAFLNGVTDFRDAALTTQADVGKALTAMDAMDVAFADDLGVKGKWPPIKSEWLALKERALGLPNAAETYKQHSVVLQMIGGLSELAQSNSTLDLDPVAETYHLQNVAFVLAFESLNDLIALRGSLTIVSALGAVSRDDAVQILSQRARIPLAQGKIRRELEKVWAVDPDARVTTEQGLKQLEDASQSVMDLALKLTAGEVPVGEKVSARTAFETGDKAARAVLALGSATSAQLMGELTNRQQALQRSNSLSLALLAVMIAVSVALAWWITRSLTRPMAHAVGVFRSISDGKYDNTIEKTGTDEAGQVLTALDDMQSKLRAQIESERAQARENMRLKSALDAASASMMVANESLQIVYINSAAQKLFREAQSDLRRDIPTLDAERIVGSAVDIFYKNPAHQRQLLEGLVSVHTDEMRIGGHAMRIFSSPVRASDGARIGTVIEWADRTQEVNAEEEVDTLVKKALDGDLAARIRIESKTGFFQVLGRGLNELIENMASMVQQIKEAATQVYRGAEEISAGNANLSQRTEQQASSLEETASSMEEMTSTVKQNADNAGQAINSPLRLAIRQRKAARWSARRSPPWRASTNRPIRSPPSSG